MRSTSKKIAVLMYLTLFAFPLVALFPISALSQDDYEYKHSGDKDTPETITRLEGAEITWKIVNASGVFSDKNTQPGDLIRYEIQEVNTADNKYFVKEAKQKWYKTEFSDYGGEIESEYYLIPRTWGDIAIKVFEARAVSYWGDQADIDRSYEATYQTEWWDWKLMNTVTIEFDMGDKGYDTIKYSRAEGILLERTAVITDKHGNNIGFLRIELEDYSQSFELSPWYYIIIVIIIIAAIAIVIITIALLIQRHKKIYREIKEI